MPDFARNFYHAWVWLFKVHRTIFCDKGQNKLLNLICNSLTYQINLHFLYCWYFFLFRHEEWKVIFTCCMILTGQCSKRKNMTLESDYLYYPPPFLLPRFPLITWSCLRTNERRLDLPLFHRKVLFLDSRISVLWFVIWRVKKAILKRGFQEK